MSTIWKYGVVALAVGGVVLGAYVVTFTNREIPPAAPRVEAPDPPFASYVWGSGIVEAGTQNVEVSSPVDGLVAEVMVSVGQTVEKDQALVRLDGRVVEASMLAQDKTILLDEAHVATAQSSLTAATGPADERSAAQGRLDEARAQLAEAQQQYQSLKVDQILLTIRSPVAGKVLALNKVAGEFVGMAAGPVAVVGDADHLRVRVQVDENDAYKVRPGARAVGSMRGNPDVRTDLTFGYIQPMVVPKTELSGDSSERVDTRVLPVVYTFDRGILPIYVGEQMDVCIDAAAGPATRNVP